jgi:phosphonate transport system permease protein
MRPNPPSPFPAREGGVDLTDARPATARLGMAPVPVTSCDQRLSLDGATPLSASGPRGGESPSAGSAGGFSQTSKGSPPYKGAGGWGYAEPSRPFLSWRTVRLVLLVAVILAFYVVCWRLAKIDPVRLWDGLPRLEKWAGRAWPPDSSELPALVRRSAETVAMAAMGTTIAAILAVPVCILASRNLTPFMPLYYPVRWFLNALRGIDSFVFALILVAAVGLGPFAGVLGVGLHTWGSMAKLYSESLEGANMAPVEAVLATGAGRPRAFLFALLPDVLPSMLSITLFWWEFNVRASTVLGVVGAGGIGQELKNSMDLLDFPRLAMIIILILVMVTGIDHLSTLLRRRLA